MTTWDTNSEQIYGQYGCKSGYSTGYQCGDILGTDLTETLTCGGTTCTEYHMWELSVRTTNGDSGGPIFDYYVEMGIVDDALGVNSYYSTID